MTVAATSIDQICIDTIRTLAMDAVQKAKSGHPGAPMGAATMAYVLWTRHLKHNPADPAWPDRDRFVLSAGHASMLLYSLLALTGYDLQIEELREFRQWGSRTPGHPEHGLTPGVEATTGPLGQGFAMGVGMALAERVLAARFNRPGHTVVDHYTYGIVSDGDLMEGVASEAASLAGTMRLGRLIYLYDDNEISIEGGTDLAFKEDVGARFAAYGWHVQHIDGLDAEAVDRALTAARAESGRPSLIVAQTVIAYGSPNKAGTADAHGSPLGEEEVRATKKAMGWPLEPEFFVPPEALAEFRKALDAGRRAEAAWDERFNAYADEHPGLAEAWRREQAGELPGGWRGAIPVFAPGDGPIATRASAGKTLSALADVIPNLIGGSADLAPSTNTYLKKYRDLGGEDWSGRNLRFGVREHAMGGISNGIALHGGLIPYCATFFVFTDYMRASIRMAAIMGTRTIFVYTHDSIGVGEDGPTHQPVEHLASLRAMPGLSLIRPADANESAAAWACALGHDGPTAMVLSRQNLPVFDDGSRVRAGAARGGYVLAEADGGAPEVIVIGTGSEVSIALEAQRLLAGEGIRARVVSLPSWDLFAAQSDDYREAVLPRGVRARVAVEAASRFGWERYVGEAGEVVGLDHFGASAPQQAIYEHFGITAAAVVAATKRVLERATRDGVQRA